MRLSILLATSVFRGDHHAEVFLAHEPLPGETVAELVARLIPKPSSGYRQEQAEDVIQIRVVLEPPLPEPDEPPAAPALPDDIPF